MNLTLAARRIDVQLRRRERGISQKRVGIALALLIDHERLTLTHDLCRAGTRGSLGSLSCRHVCFSGFERSSGSAGSQRVEAMSIAHASCQSPFSRIPGIAMALFVARRYARIGHRGSRWIIDAL